MACGLANEVCAPVNANDEQDAQRFAQAQPYSEGELTGALDFVDGGMQPKKSSGPSGNGADRGGGNSGGGSGGASMAWTPSRSSPMVDGKGRRQQWPV